MRIRSRAWKKNSGTGDSSSFFFFSPAEKEMEKQANNSENFTKEQSKCSGGGGKGLRALNTRGPLFLHSRCCLYC